MPQRIYYEGSGIEFTTDPSVDDEAVPFTTAGDAGIPFDPDVVTFSYAVTSQAGVGASAWTSFTWTNGSGDPSNTITHGSTGCFTAKIDTTGKAGIWTYRWTGKPGLSGLDTTKSSAVYVGEVQVAVSQ